MTTRQRYWLYQLPGFAALMALLGAAARWFSVPWWVCGLVAALWIAKDWALYPLLKAGYEGGKPTGTDVMIGALGVASEDLRPHGLVRIGPELWQAEAVSEAEAGQAVQVTGVEGMTLRVEPLPAVAGAASGSKVEGRDDPR